VPQVEIEAAKVRSEAARLSIAAIHLSAARQLAKYELSQRSGRRNHIYYMIHALRMEVSAVPLKLGGEQDRVGMIDLLCRNTPAACGTANSGVSAGNLVQCPSADCAPIAIGIRRHAT